MNKAIKGLVISAGILAGVFAPSAISSFLHRDSVYIDISANERSVFSGNTREIGQKDITLKFGEPFEYHFGCSNRDGIVKTITYVNGNVYSDNKVDPINGKYTSFIGGVGYFTKDRVVDNLKLGQNTIKYEVVDCLGNVNSDEIRVNLTSDKK